MAEIERSPLAPSTVRDGALAELEHLSGTIEHLSFSDWSQPSAVEGWTIGDVVAHLAVFLGLYNRLMGVVLYRGGSGSAATTIGRLTDTVMPASGPLFDRVYAAIPPMMNRLISPEVVKGQFAAGARKTRERLLRVGPEEDSRFDSVENGPYPLSFYLAIAVNELAIHGWDIASATEGETDLSDDARRILPWFYWTATKLMLRLPDNTTGTIQVLLDEAGSAMWWSIGDKGIRQGRAMMPVPDATIRGPAGPYILNLAGRLKPAGALSSPLAIEGNRRLAESFLRGWRIV